MMKEIPGGVCAAKGFAAAGVHCGIRKNKDKKDLALIVSEKKASAAAVYTQNLIIGAPCTVTKKHLENGTAQAVICNSGIANTCAADGIEKADEMCRLTAAAAGIDENDIVVASTGVIGPSINIEPIANAMPSLVSALSADGNNSAAQAIMTTDTVSKECAVEFTVGGQTCRVGGMAKGSGMIAPNMATMLSFITTDADVDADILKMLLADTANKTFNMITIDGDTSTNDMLVILANGMSAAPKITGNGPDLDAFRDALHYVCTSLCKMLAADGEGATKLIECRVNGALTEKDASLAAKSVMNSALFKAAMFGADANWGRVLCALGYSGAKTNPTGIHVSFESAAGRIDVCKNGAGIAFSEEKAKAILSEKEIVVDITMSDGSANAVAWGCDLSYDYVRINGDYRS